SLATGNYQQIGLLWKRRGWLRHPFLLFQVLSHKVLRLLSPFLILSLYASSAWLLASPLYGATCAAMTVFFVAALAGVNAQLRPASRRSTNRLGSSTESFDVTCTKGSTGRCRHVTRRAADRCSTSGAARGNTRRRSWSGARARWWDWTSRRICSGSRRTTPD